MSFWRGTFLDHVQHEECGRFIGPTDAVPSYGRDQMAMLGTTALMLCEQPSTQMSAVDREALLAVFLQFGVDSYGMIGAPNLLLGDERRFVGGGGHSGGRKYAVLYAGIVTDNPGMRDAAGRHSNGFGQRWKEDAQCLVSGQLDWQGLRYRWRSAEAIQVVYQDVAPYDSQGVSHWTYEQCRDENYRVCCTLPAYIYFDLACRLMENHPAAVSIAHAMEAWGNDAFFGCVDRFMLPMTPEACDVYDNMELIRQAAIQVCLLTHPPQECDLEEIKGHYQGWGTSVGVLNRSRYGQDMWRSFRWQKHQRGVSVLGPTGFAGAEHDCAYGPPLYPDPSLPQEIELRCQKPTEGGLAPRSLPTLLTEQPAAINTTMWFEVHGVPPDSALAVYVAGGPMNPILLNPSMPCACVTQSASLCGAPLLVDYPNAASLTLVQTGPATYDYRNLSFPLALPPVVGSFAIQAVMMRLDLSNYVSSNAYAITTY